MKENKKGHDGSRQNGPVTARLRDACIDLLYLRDRGYPAKPAAELVSNFYRLSSVQRSVLRRGVVPGGTAESRRLKLISPEEVAGQLLSMDGCNVLAVLGNYLSGRFVYIGSDGLVRDAAESSGVFRNGERRRRAAALTAAALGALRPGRVHVYIDEPLPHSRDMAGELRRELEAAGIDAEVEPASSVDRLLKNSGGILVSADSEIVDCAEHVFDLARYVLETSLGADLFDLGRFI